MACLFCVADECNNLGPIVFMLLRGILGDAVRRSLRMQTRYIEWKQVHQKSLLHLQNNQLLTEDGNSLMSIMYLDILRLY